MKEEYRKWHTRFLGRDFEMLVFGHAGRPVIMFPTSQGRYYQDKDFGLVDAIKWYIDEGLIRVYCPDSIDGQSWYNKSIHPADRIKTHLAYENVILNDLLPWARHDTGVDKAILVGPSFGGYHAVNTAFRHPSLFSHVISMSGAFDMRQFMDGYHDQEFYFCNPVDFVGGMPEGETLQQIREMSITLACSDNDICKDDNFNFHNLLKDKGISHWFDFRAGTSHDWPVWFEMLPLYLSKIDYSA